MNTKREGDGTLGPIEAKAKYSGNPYPGWQSSLHPNVLLLDDDPLFCKVVQRIAKKLKIPITVYQSVNEILSLNNEKAYDVAIIDYYLDDLNGIGVASLLKDIPVVLVSRSRRWADEGDDWHGSIKKFVHKKYGAEAILKAAIEASRKFVVN